MYIFYLFKKQNILFLKSEIIRQDLYINWHCVINIFTAWQPVDKQINQLTHCNRIDVYYISIAQARSQSRIALQHRLEIINRVTSIESSSRTDCRYR